LGPDARDDASSRLTPWRPSLQDVCDANRAILDAYEHPEFYRLRDRGFLEKALDDGCNGHLDASDHYAAIRAAARLAHLIARAQAFRDGNHRTAFVVAQTYLANNDLGALSVLGTDDIELADHVAGTGIKYQPAKYNPVDTVLLLQARFERLYSD
jgi:hypothetical protein